MLFGWKIRDKLPTLKEHVEETQVRDKDMYEKGKSLRNSASGRIAEKIIEVGNKVLIKRAFHRQKEELKFEPEVGTVESVNNPEVLEKTPTQVVRRHKNQVNQYIRRSIDEPAKDECNNNTVSDLQDDIRRSNREVRAPKWLNVSLHRRNIRLYR